MAELGYITDNFGKVIEKFYAQEDVKVLIATTKIDRLFRVPIAE